jgi:Protein of unknown function (DUF3800)
MTNYEPLFVQDRCLAAFVDDTGHEALVKGHPIYGLGGCATLGRDLERIVTRPWREVRRRVTGSPDTPLHANTFPSIAKPGDIQFAADFFRQPFWRFGAIFTEKTKLADLSLLQSMRMVLEKRLQQIVEGTLCKEVKVIFESSERADKLIVAAFQNLNFHRGWKRIPAECYFMPKSAAYPALEVADFVMHAIGRQARHDLKQRGSFVPDFCAVFHSVGGKLVNFSEIESVESASQR